MAHLLVITAMGLGAALGAVTKFSLGHGLSGDLTLELTGEGARAGLPLSSPNQTWIGMSVMRCLADQVTPLPYVCLVPIVLI